MDLPNIGSWTAGTGHDDEQFNALSYAQRFLLDPPEAEVRQTSAQSIPTGIVTATALTFDTEVKDNDALWVVGDPTKLTINTNGWYEIGWAVKWATKADTTIRIAGIAVNGVLTVASLTGMYDAVNESGTAPQLRGNYDMYLTDDDYIQLAVAQSSGSALSTGSGAGATSRTMLRVRWSSM